MEDLHLRSLCPPHIRRLWPYRICTPLPPYPLQKCKVQVFNYVPLKQVPQFQKSKGCLILTAALELSRNQVTHFYSKAKNTTEMIKLLEILLEEYKGCDKLFFPWDAASWHASKELKEKVERVNLPDFREAARTPFVELVPLPKSAQFLNVIESVFSGMARAIIHNSDYHSVQETVTAIDRYFQERNIHFLRNPKRAGKKIWGQETVLSEFSESNNCKDPRYGRSH